MKRLFGLWLPFEGNQWLGSAGQDVLFKDEEQAKERARAEAPAHFMVACLYDQGHYFHSVFNMCSACKATPTQARGRWCPHSNPPIEVEAAELARKLWDTDDRTAALTVEAAEGREPSTELLDRLFDRNTGGLRGEAEARARAMLGR
jgi:hypothetical protein